MAPGAKVVFATHTVEAREFRASAAYNEFYQPHDLEHVVCAWITSATRYGAPGMAGIFLARSAKQPDFAEREVVAVERALPAFAAAARRSARAEAEGRRHHVLDALLGSAASRPLLALDTRGRLLWIAEPAERLLAPILGRRRALPEALVDAARSLGAVAITGSTDVAPPSRFSIAIPLPDGSLLRAELALTRTRSGEPIIAIELEAQGPRPAFADFVARHRLTRAEVDVLRALARGLANQEIAGGLFVSVETVRTHVRRVLAKLDVPTRARAAVLVRDLLG
jgi:DNA-binding CsgD family transcriptional regulator